MKVKVTASKMVTETLQDMGYLDEDMKPTGQFFEDSAPLGALKLAKGYFYVFGGLDGLQFSADLMAELLEKPEGNADILRFLIFFTYRQSGVEKPSFSPLLEDDEMLIQFCPGLLEALDELWEPEP